MTAPMTDERLAELLTNAFCGGCSFPEERAELTAELHRSRAEAKALREERAALRAALEAVEQHNRLYEAFMEGTAAEGWHVSDLEDSWKRANATVLTALGRAT